MVKPYRIVAFDPSTKSTGYAVTQINTRGNPVFVSGGAVRASGLVEMIAALKGLALPSCDVAMIERPQHYGDKTRKADHNKLSMVTLVAGACAGIVNTHEVRFAYPQEWKGQVPKDVHHRRFLKNLDPANTKHVNHVLNRVPRTSQNDFLDALILSFYKGARK